MNDIVMPRLSDTMEEGTILRWLKRDGEEVRRGEELVEIETDKATMNYESDQDGVLQLIASEGDTLAVGEVIARVADADRAAAASPSAAAAADQAQASKGQASVPAQGADGRASGSQAAAQPARAQGDELGRGGARIKASPLARRIARESGVDLRALRGSGQGGRIVRADVQGAGTSARAGAWARAGRAGQASGSATQPGAGAPMPSGTSLEGVATAKGDTTTLELSRTQQTIARRMAESKATIPDFTLQSEVDMEECIELRAELKRLSQPEAPTYNDMVVKACALALREHPRANGGYRDGLVQLHSRVNVGVAVAAEGALVVPTVFDADEKSLGEIARETRALAERVRAGSITPPELGGGTFTVSNLGMYGVRSFTAIINPPQAAILSVGSLQARAVVHAGEVLARHTMILTLACDHRILYGADAARFLARIRELLEAPAALTL
jgi:pyruvate dehydrogenase E2 component (dihydrolipoyllysine-residue acetyltransferase)